MSYTNSVDLEIQDVTKFPSAHAIPTSITTISSMSAAGGPPLATASIVNPKVTSSAAATSSAIHSVDKIIEFPLIEKTKSYQQQHQLIDVCSGSTVNHNNNIVVANHALNFGNSSGAGKMAGIDVGNLPLNSTYTAVASLTSNDKSSVKTYKQSNVSFFMSELKHFIDYSFLF